MDGLSPDTKPSRMSRRQQVILILILGALSTISPFSIDMYLPGFPAIAKDLNTSIHIVQLSLTSYFVGIAVGQLLYGPLLDRFGRKQPLYAGLLIYIVASVGCATTGSADALIAMRFFQAIGGCAGMVAAQALVRDLFPVEKTAQVFSWIILVIVVSPMIAPAVGGYVTVAFGWEAVFIVLAVLALLFLVAVYVYLPDGRKPDPDLSLRPAVVTRNFLAVGKQPQFLLYTVAGGIATAAPFAYIAGSADVFINIYQTSEQEYGWIFAFIAFFVIGSSQLNHLLLRHFTSEQIIRTTLTSQTVIGAGLLLLTLFGAPNKYVLIGFISIFLTGQGLTGPNSNALSLAPFSRHVGSAASLSGSFRMGMGGIVTALVSVLHNGTAIPMISVMVGCVFLGFVVLLLGIPYIPSESSTPIGDDTVTT